MLGQGKYLSQEWLATRHMERYGLMTAVPTLTALLLLGLNEVQFFFAFLYTVLGFLCAKHYR